MRSRGPCTFSVLRPTFSVEAAVHDYGVAMHPAWGEDQLVVDFVVNKEITARTRAKLKAARKNALPMIDRGTGYDKMQRGEFKPWVRSG